MRTLTLVSLALLVGCPSPDNPARDAVDAQGKPEETTPKPAEPAQPTGGATSVTWSCPMHPEVVQDKPGICPKCNMDLVKQGS